MSRALHDKVRKVSRALYAEPAGIGAIADAFYNHVRETLDLEALNRIEQELWSVLDAAGIEDELGELSSKMVRDAIIRLADDPMRNISDVPYGITEEEAAAVAYDDECPFCVLEAAQPKTEPAHDDDCSCCAMIAAEWRAQHAEVLARAGLAPRRPARAVTS